jgi:hypothetical protein
MDSFKSEKDMLNNKYRVAQKPVNLKHSGAITEMLGRAIAEAVSRWLPTAAARVQTWV